MLAGSPSVTEARLLLLFKDIQKQRKKYFHTKMSGFGKPLFSQFLLSTPSPSSQPRLENAQVAQESDAIEFDWAHLSPKQVKNNYIESTSQIFDEKQNKNRFRKSLPCAVFSLYFLWDHACHLFIVWIKNVSA